MQVFDYSPWDDWLGSATLESGCLIPFMRILGFPVFL